MWADNAVGLYSAARGYLLGAGHIFRALPVAERNINPCIQFLLGFAVECFLKAYLAYTGYAEKQLRAIGHDLVLAMQTAETEGLVLPDQSQVRFVVDCLAPGHLRQHYRYLLHNPDGSIRPLTMVYPRTAFEALCPLDETMFRLIQADINGEEKRLGLPVTIAWPGIPPL